jgi:hypothetical protein
METTIEIFRVILEVCRKYDHPLGFAFRYPIFQPGAGYRFHYTNHGLQYLETPYAKFILHASGNGDTLLAIRDEVFRRLGKVITHIHGKPVEMTCSWDKAKYNEELKKHLHLMYDPEEVLFRVSVNEDFYIKAKEHYVNGLAADYENRYGKKFGRRSILMLNDDHIYIQLVGLSVQLYNQL